MVLIMGQLFLTSKPGTDAAVRIYRLAEVVKCARHFGGDLIVPHHLHITLFPLDDRRYSLQHTVLKACEAAQEVRMPPFEVWFDRIGSFRGRQDNHAFVLLGGDGLSGLRLLRQTLVPSNQASTLFAAISVLLGFLFAFNAMLLTVPERRQVIAGLRVDGTRRSAILQMVVFQALCLGVVASVLGLAVGYGIALILASSIASSFAP